MLIGFSQTVFAQTELTKDLAKEPNAVIQQHVIDDHKFYGMAAYYNAATVHLVSPKKMKDVKPGSSVILGAEDWLAVMGRFDVLLVKAEGLTAQLGDDGETLSWSNPSPLLKAESVVELISKPNLKARGPELNQLRYSHLIWPIKMLSRGLEWMLVKIHALFGHWGLAIILISLFLKIALLPLAQLVKRYQTQVSQTQSKLAPRLAEIKATLKGEEAHTAFMKAHKDAGVTTFYTLKPMVGLLVQVPIWIAIFNSLAEMPQLKGEAFLWIKDLAYPDAVSHWGSALPLLGDTLNLLPLIMTIITIISTLYFQDRHAPADILRKQKRNLFFMAAAFLVLFYPFPSGMVLYWTLANILNFGQQMLSKG